MTIEHDVVFHTVSGRELRLDLYRPPSTGPNHRTAVIQLHGGAFRLGSRSMMAPRAEALSALGFVCLAAEYRFVPEAPWPAQLHDVKAAIRWTREHADDLGIDTDRVVVQGNSAGGHLALMAAGTADQPAWDTPDGNDVSTAVAAAVATYAPVELFDVSDRFPEGVEVELADLAGLARPDGSSPAAILLGGCDDASAAAAASPITYVSPAFPPTLFIHGSADTAVNPNGSHRMHRALLEHGVTADLIQYSDQIHEFDAGPLFAGLVAEVIAGFLRRVIIEPGRFSEEQLEYNPFLQNRPSRPS